METVQIIGYLAAAAVVLGFVPQVIRVIKTRRTRDISLGMFIILPIGASLWLAYGWMIGDLPIIITNLSLLILQVIIVIFKLKLG